MSRIFLIGYRGTGKTTVARLLADRLGWGWSDADKVLEERVGLSIRLIFEQQGEASFRDMESAVLDDLVLLERHVIATGGGIVLRPENRAKLRAGKVIWLTASSEVLWQRMREDDSTHHRRPDLAQGGLAEIECLLRTREPWYSACADWKVDTSVQSPEDVADAIYHWLEK